ncbi:MAG: helix-turn-helix domain-containing protein [Spirochaetes bacterium]|nr:helix-turn-helix domain-containing protein [Spirochaetota bacterium]
MKRIIDVQRSISPPRLNPVHEHDFWEIVFYTKGKGILLLSGEECAFSANDLFCFPPGMAHGERSAAGYASTWIRFRDDSLTPEGLYMMHDPAHRPLAKLVGLIYHEYVFDAGLHDLCRDLLDPLVGYIIRQNRYSRSDARVKTIEHMLIDNITNPDFQITKALDETGAPYITQHLLFKKNTGRSPQQFLLDLRIKESRMLLGVNGLSLREIARQTGFRDPYYFSRIFKKKTGKSPAAYRKSLRRDHTS